MTFREYRELSHLCRSLIWFCRGPSTSESMPIHAAKEHQAPDDERVALLSADEENQQQDACSKAFKGNGLPSADHVKGSTKYGAVWQRATQTAIRNKHRFEISRKLQSFKVEDFEKHRKSDEEIKQIKDKKIKKYYQEQNRRLNDWLEGEPIPRTRVGYLVANR